MAEIEKMRNMRGKLENRQEKEVSERNKFLEKIQQREKGDSIEKEELKDPTKEIVYRPVPAKPILIEKILIRLLILILIILAIIFVFNFLYKQGLLPKLPFLES